MRLNEFISKALSPVLLVTTLVATYLAGTCEAACTIDYNNTIASSPPYYGSSIFWTDEDIDLIRERITTSNMNIMRLFLFPFYIENQNDNADPHRINWNGFTFEAEIEWFGKTASYLTVLETLKLLDINIMVCIPYLTPWLSDNTHGPTDIYATYPPNNNEEYREFVYAVLYYMVYQVGISPGKIILEPFNEPDLGCGQDSTVHCFWNNHTMDDTVNTFLAAYTAAQSVSPAIRTVGMAEWDDGRYVRHFIDSHNGINYLDGITYHKYSEYYDITGLITMGTGLKDAYGLPVFVDEYGSRTWGSNGREGALWHSYSLTQLWKNGIQPLQYPFCEFPGIGEPYESMGLFYDWTSNWQVKDSFWVYTNFLRFMKDTAILYAEEDIGNVDLIAGRKEERLTIVITNRDTLEKNIPITVNNLPGNYTRVIVYDNLQEDHPITTFGISGNSFEYVMLPKSSVTLCIRVTSSGEDCTDSIDNDGDGDVDCNDPDCMEDSACVTTSTTTSSNSSSTATSTEPTSSSTSTSSPTTSISQFPTSSTTTSSVYSTTSSSTNTTSSTTTTTASCFISINPDPIEITSMETMKFTILKEGDCNDPDYEWSVNSTTGGVCDESGNYTAGINLNMIYPTIDVIEVVDHANNDITAVATITVHFACPATQIYGKHSAKTEALRYFRDNILSKTHEGRELIQLYYQWSPVIVRAMEQDEDFKEDIKELFDGVLEMIEGAVEMVY